MFTTRIDDWVVASSRLEEKLLLMVLVLCLGMALAYIN